MLDASQIFDGTVIAESAPANQGSTITGVAITATAQSTNVLDLLVGRDVGAGNPLGLHVDITQAFTTTNSATLQIAFQVSASTNSGFVNLVLSPPVPVAQLIKGAPIFRYALPLNQLLNATAGILGVPGRYIALDYIVGTGVFSAGAVFSYLTPIEDRNQQYTYPSNYLALAPSGEI